MIAGRNIWVVIWSGILLLGMLALVPSVYWGRQTKWKNLDEVLRAVGAVVVSSGMLLILLEWSERAGEVLLVLAVGCFGWAFFLGRKRKGER